MRELVCGKVRLLQPQSVATDLFRNRGGATHKAQSCQILKLRDGGGMSVSLFPPRKIALSSPRHPMLSGSSTNSLSDK